MKAAQMDDKMCLFNFRKNVNYPTQATKLLCLVSFELFQE